MSELRTATGRIEFDGGTGRFRAVAVRYNTIDTYRTRFVPGCFTRSLKERLPLIVWQHQIADPIGHVVSYQDGPTQLEVEAQLDDPEAVPSARRAWVQMRSGTITDVSVGFMRLDSRPARGLAGVTDITLALLEEVSPVSIGAVPGAKVLATRSGRPDPADELVARWMTRARLRPPKLAAPVRRWMP